jgi:hypothetical protein
VPKGDLAVLSCRCVCVCRWFLWFACRWVIMQGNQENVGASAYEVSVSPELQVSPPVVSSHARVVQPPTPLPPVQPATPLPSAAQQPVLVSALPWQHLCHHSMHSVSHGSASHTLPMPMAMAHPIPPYMDQVQSPVWGTLVAYLCTLQYQLQCRLKSHST